MKVYASVCVVVAALSWAHVASYSISLELRGGGDDDDAVGGEVSSRLYSKYNKWPLVDHTIYYDVHPDLHFHTHIKEAVEYAIEYMNAYTCVRWAQRMPWDPNVKDYVVFFVTLGKLHCKADEGYHRTYGKHYIQLGDYCFADVTMTFGKLAVYSAVLHEMLHILGFQHEHQRPDRDCYITVPEEDIINYPDALLIHSTSLRGFIYRDFPYDYKSIMHYRYKTIHANDPNITLSRYDGIMTEFDVWKVNSLYCDKTPFCELTSSNCKSLEDELRDNRDCHRIDYFKVRNEIVRRQTEPNGTHQSYNF